MRKLFSEQLESHLAFHRGIGKENTLTALHTGVEESPYLQEFDVQRYTRLQKFAGKIIGRQPPAFDHRNELALGHPPETNLNGSLDQALELFRDTAVIPKIDVKPQWWQLDHYKTIDMLLTALEKFERPSLINVSGSPRNIPFIAPKPAAFLELERYVARHAPSQAMINLDLGRFGDLSDIHVARHIETLREGSPERVHSFSPLIDDTNGVDRSIELALRHSVSDLHFWGIKTHSYHESDLVALAKRVTAIGLHPVIDIDLESIVPLSVE